MAKRELKTKKTEEPVTEVVVETTAVVEDENTTTEPVIGVVTGCTKLYIRKKPKVDDSNVMGTINAKEKVAIDTTYEHKEWYKLIDGSYCMKKYITIK